MQGRFCPFPLRSMAADLTPSTLPSTEATPSRSAEAAQFPVENAISKLSVIELDDGKIYRKALYLMVKTMVSCKFSLKPIQWISMRTRSCGCSTSFHCIWPHLSVPLCHQNLVASLSLLKDPDATVEFPKAVDFGEPQAESTNVIDIHPSADEPGEPDDEDALCVQAASDHRATVSTILFINCLSVGWLQSASLQTYMETPSDISWSMIVLTLDQGEFSLWAAPRWHLLRELLMDEDLNNTALGGFTVGKFQALNCELMFAAPMPKAKSSAALKVCCDFTLATGGWISATLYHIQRLGYLFCKTVSHAIHRWLWKFVHGALSEGSAVCMHWGSLYQSSWLPRWWYGSVPSYRVMATILELFADDAWFC